MHQDLALGSDTVDVSMATLASVWARDPYDLSERQHEPLTVWESENFNSSPPAGVMWMEQLSPRLQRNKQLQDTLLQREEELARLQDENNRLREFLNSSFVRDLEKKAKKLTTDGRMKLKRNMMHVRDEPSNINQLVGPQQVSKRVCRNLTAEFCSEFQETSVSSDSNLDLWVLRTLGLKDQDTIDTSMESLSSSGCSLQSLGHDSAAFSTSEPPSSNIYCQNGPQQSEYGDRVECHKENCDRSAKSPDQHFTATGLNGHYEAPDAVTDTCTSTAFQSPSLTELLFTPSPNRAHIYSTTGSSQAMHLHQKQAEPSAYWPPLQCSRTPSQDTIRFRPPEEKVHLSPSLTSSPCFPKRSCTSTSPATKSQPLETLQMQHCRTDLAFSMSLSPSSSVKTHSFPQGQAFVRKDSEGRWNFTWVPRQGH